MMDLVTLDYETYWADDYTLSKLTTEAYVRDPRFESIMCAFKVNHEKTFWVPKPDVPRALKDLRLDTKGVLCHHAHFDCFILNHHYGVRPKAIFDTLGMGRAVFGKDARLSLAKLAERLGVGKKGEEVVLAKNMAFSDFTPRALAKYGVYCANDVDLTRRIFDLLVGNFTKAELQLNDHVVRMFTEPRLVLNLPKLERYVKTLGAEKTTLLLQAGVQVGDVMSNEKFATALRNIGIDPPLKISPATGKPTYAFAKTDPGIQALQEHPDPQVQVLIEARLKNKTTQAERMSERLIAMGGRGAATIYLKFSGAAGTHRLSAGDKINNQAWMRGGMVREAVEAAPGYKVVAGDSSNIEARMLDYLAGQMDMVDVYRKADAKLGPDMYCTIGGRIYGFEVIKGVHIFERQMGKVAKLGLGFGMGSEKFGISVRRQAKGEDGKPLILTHHASVKIVAIYRDAHPQVLKLWKRGEQALAAIANGNIGVDVDFRGIVKTCKDGLVLPGGVKILYPELKKEKNATTGWDEWTFWNGKLREHIYGPKVIENIIQCLARTVVMYQCMKVARDLKAHDVHWVHSVHDEGIFVVPDFVAPYATDYLLTTMRESPWFAPDLPLNSEGGFHQSYGRAKQ